MSEPTRKAAYPKYIGVRLTEQQALALQALSKRTEQRASSVVRSLIAEAALTPAGSPRRAD